MLMIQFSMKNIFKFKMPINHRAMSVLRRLPLTTKKHEIRLATKFQTRTEGYKINNISTYGKINSKLNPFAPNSSDGNYCVDVKDKTNFVLPVSDDTYFRAVCNKQEQFLINQLQIEMERADRLSNEDWDKMRNLVLKNEGNINENNIDAVIMNKCSEFKLLSLGKSYFKYLKSSQKPINRAIFGNYLRLFFSCKSDCSSDDLNEIAVVYKELLEVHPLLDSHTAEKAVCALSLTRDWKEYEKLFIAIKQFYNPSVFVYITVIQTAFDHQEFEIGWKLMEEMENQGQNVPDEVFLYWLEKVKCRKLDEDVVRVLKFFSYFNIKPSNEVCKGIREAFKMNHKERRVTFTRIARNGECRSCHSKLEPCYVSQEDYDQLKKAFLNPVIIGKDIFQKTKPEEFTEFLDFLKKSAPFSVVLDGLNIALQSNRRSVADCTFRLKSVVKHFVTLDKNVLVLGRKHMATWNTPDMEYINKNAHLFLTDNLSQDDPFMLYAALYSGLETCFVSRDMMRGHKFLLANPKLQITFQKWQALRQYFIAYIERNGNVHFQEPVSFLQTIQQNSHGYWHIPYFIKGEELTSRDRVDHLHRHWMCMQNQPLVATQQSSQTEQSIKHFKRLETTRPIRKSTTSINIKNLFEDDGR